ncbi:aminotransferase class V-fold PLP-dependent enzyme [Runella sp. CRIBMP]|uniref:aminotransferase class V-fold PLP-dependent enzyme n=1 Tax=Runella sp. CRIBMP TaxID=2683261 RepID=UPI00141360EB|nr:aminotransferase class V-fold PLP-dependent enzyme [Runella sp. CRIBMP]NBB20721.1 aminotransferase class V-fold PLP-dependent enzyme [Runella sp. CRIBMP]
MITFYPGPSKVYPQVEGYLQDAFRSGILSMNHRSQGFMEVLRETIRLMHLKLNIPEDYSIYLVSSATEAWEIIAQSLTLHHSAHHYNGAFGKKWFSYASHIVPQSSGSLFSIEQTLTHHLFDHENDVVRAEFNRQRLRDYEVLCLTHSETSNGTHIRMEELAKIRTMSDALIAIDATSSLGGVAFDWALGDVWFASVQKCLGLPAGLGIMVCSPKTLEKARQANDILRYNSLLFIHDNFEKYQTHYTPNTLGIYLLMRVMEQVDIIQEVGARSEARAKAWYSFLENETDWRPLVQNPSTRSDTVIAVKGEPEAVSVVKKAALSAGITLGNGYGEWKNNTFRIANFPAFEDEEVAILKTFLKKRART